MIVMDWTGEAIGGNASMIPATATHRRRVQAALEAVTTPGGELHPRKWFIPSVVTTLNRGAPAPQCDPLGTRAVGPFRISYPSSVRVIPFTPFTSAPADAKLFVGPVFTSRSPSVLLSPCESPVMQAGSVKEPAVVPSFVGASVGQPVPLSQRALTREVLNGSKSNGTTLMASFASSDSSSSVQAIALGSSDTRIPRDRALTSQSVFGVAAVRSARGALAGGEFVGVSVRSQATPKPKMAG